MPKLQSTEIAQTLRRRSATLIGAVLIGLAGLSFATAADWVQSLFGDLPPGYDVLPVVIAPLGFAALAFLTLRFAPAARGSGIPQVIAAAPLPEPETSPLISLKTAAAKALLTLGGLLVGASAGREGPTVQISAAIMVAVHRIFGVRLSPAVVIAAAPPASPRPSTRRWPASPSPWRSLPRPTSSASPSSSWPRC